MNPNIFLTGGIIAAIAAAWGQIKTLWSQLASIVIVQITVQHAIVDAMLAYLCQEQFRLVRLGHQSYVGSWMRVRSMNRIQLVAWQMLNRAGHLYLDGWKPLWVSHGQSGNGSPTDYSDLSPSVLKISFFRGTFNPDSLIIDSVKFYNGLRDQVEKRESRRFFIKRVYGVSKKLLSALGREDEKKNPSSKSSGDSLLSYLGSRPVGFSRNELGSSDESLRVRDLALTTEAEEAILEARRWKESEKWYQSKGLPWKRGWNLYGSPGNGKTAMIRALSLELDLPVFIYDLASLANDEMQAAWTEMLSSVPCVALIEDVDGVFHKRETLVGDLTFDCLLNCIDGIEASDGLFIVITTNNIDSLDEALGIPSADGITSTRPGRVDRVIHMTPPNREGRYKIARRILSEFPDIIDNIVNDGKNDSGAQFQERCSAIALRLFWEGKNA